jgi:hypothetical protein
MYRGLGAGPELTGEIPERTEQVTRAICYILQQGNKESLKYEEFHRETSSCPPLTRSKSFST